MQPIRKKIEILVLKLSKNTIKSENASYELAYNNCNIHFFEKDSTLEYIKNYYKSQRKNDLTEKSAKDLRGTSK